MTSEVEEAASRPRHRSWRKVRRRWQQQLSSWPPWSLLMLLGLIHNARYSMQQQASSSSKITLFDLDNDGGPLDEHSVEKRKIGDVSVGCGRLSQMPFCQTVVETG